jgi:hypothetical protein
LFPASLPSGLPQNPNVLLIRTHPNPSPSVANTDTPQDFVLWGIRPRWQIKTPQNQTKKF